MLKPQTIMGFAKLIAKESKCCKYSVGAVIVLDGKIIGHGCNGTPSGLQNCGDHAAKSGWLNEDGQLTDYGREEHSKWTPDNEVHAEINAVLNSGTSVRGSDVYVTMSPCKNCAKTLAQAKVRKVYYSEIYENNGLEMLESAGVICERIF